MTQTQQHPPNKTVQNGQQKSKQRPHKDLDLYDKAVDPSLTDNFLNDNNLGLGFLSEGEVYQQIESYRMGMFAEAAFSDLLDKRRVEETKRTLAREGYTYIDEEGNEKEFSGWNDKSDDTKAKKDRRRYIQERKEQIWNSLPDDQQGKAIIDLTGVPDWMPPQFRMVLMRNESSKSKDARTQDNLFGRVKKYIEDGTSSGGKKGARQKLKNLTNGGGR